MCTDPPCQFPYIITQLASLFQTPTTQQHKMTTAMSSSAQVMWELLGEELIMSSEQGQLPPGFRFHPTDEELITHYLASKVFNSGLCGIDIVEIDLNRCEPWELPDVAKTGEREWYFFSLRDRKYPTGLRTNRATGAGYWKATGKDREVHAAANGALVGMKKTLVFYKGRAPRGEKTKWVLHEYRLEGDYSCRHACKEEWVICRIFNKSAAAAAAEKKSQYYNNTNNQAYYFDPSPSTPTAAAASHPGLQTLETPIKSLLQNNNTNLFLQPHESNPNPNPNLYFPQPSSNIQSFLKSQFIPRDNSVGPPQEEALISNWLDVYLQQNPGIYELAFGDQVPLFGVGGGGDLCSMWGPP